MEFLQAIGIDQVEARDRYLAGRLMEHLKGMPEVEILTPFEDRSRCGMVTFRPRRGSYQKLKDELLRAGYRVRPVGEHDLGGIRVSCHVYALADDVDRFVVELRKILAT